MENMLWMVPAAMFGMRLLSVRRFWRMPLKHGGDRLFMIELGPEVFRREAPGLLRQYRAWLFAPFALDAVVLAALAAADRLGYAVLEQAVATVLGVIYFNCLMVHYWYRAKSLVPGEDSGRPTAVLLSLEPRRLRDHTSLAVEAVIAVAVVAFVASLTAGRAALAGQGEFRPAVSMAACLLYAQVGLVLLKVVFVRWRMKLPVRRTEDFVRWRTAWLTYHIRIFDALRLLLALGLLCPLAPIALGIDLDAPDGGFWWTVLVVWVLAVAAFLAYSIREQRRLSAVEREVRPAELVSEFPSSPVAPGRFMAGGLLYFNPENPVVLARGPAGIALNLANGRTYLWVGYLVGLVLLMAWQVTG